MKKSAKELAVLGLMTALMVGVQIPLSFVSGVELITVLFLAFTTVNKNPRALIVGLCFSFLRCIYFGFFPTVVILYIIYYCLFAVVFGALGGFIEKREKIARVLICTLVACVMTVIFTLLDDIISPLFYGMSLSQAYGYFLSSIPVMTVHIISTFISVLILYLPLEKLFRKIK